MATPPRFPVFAALTLLLGLLLVPPSALAQGADTGAILVRVVTDGATPVEGAAVRAVGLERVVISDARGQARLSGVPAGPTVVQVSLLGYGETEARVTVVAGEAARLDVALEAQAVIVEGLTVRGQSRSAEAFNRQQSAANIRNVVSSEHVERFPDTNTSDVLRRIPGIAAQDDRGETGMLFMRGLAPQFTSVTMDGQRVPSTTRDDRGTSLSSLPAEMLGSMEVIKALTPDMDADAIAGSIELRPRRPTSRQFDGRIEGGLHATAEGPTGRAALTFGDRIGATGFVLSGDFSRQNRLTEALAYDWTNLGSGVLNESHLDRLRVQSYPILRTRYGLSGHVDHALSERSSLFLRGFFTRYDTREERHRITYRLDAGDRVSPNEITQGRIETEGREYLRQRHIYALTAGADHTFDGLRMDYQVGWTRADRTEPYRDYYEYRLGNVDMRSSTSDRYRPQVEVLNGDPSNPASFALRHFDQRTDDMRDGSLTGSLNFEVPWSPGMSDGSVQFGVRGTTRTKDRDYNERRWGSFPGSFTKNDIGVRNNGRNVLGNYDMGGIVDWGVARGWWEENGSIFSFDEDDSREDSDSEDYSARESVLASYGMTTLEFGALQLLAGVRGEFTATNYEGNRLVFDRDGSWQETVPVEGSDSYLNLFPMLHLRYRLDPETNLRLAATKAIARPGFLELAPNEFISFEDEEITRGNPDLPPARSINLDVMAERYFGGLGVLSGGVFYKRISDFTYRSRTTLSSGEFAGFELFEPLAGDQADVWGFEVNWQQRLTFLPGVLSGLGVFANYAWTDSRTELGPGSDRDLPLPEQVPHIVNAALTFEQGGFVGVASFNHQGAYVRSVGSSDLSDEFKGGRQQVDFSFHQRISPTLRVFAQVNNLLDRPYIRYIGTPDFPDSSDYHGRWAAVGLRFNF